MAFRKSILGARGRCRGQRHIYCRSTPRMAARYPAKSRPRFVCIVPCAHDAKMRTPGVPRSPARYLRDAGINLIAADSPESFLNDTPTAVMIRQVQGAFAQFEKAMLVTKLKGARDRKKAEWQVRRPEVLYRAESGNGGLGQEARALPRQRP
jgi:hypothetical protein